MIGYIYKTTNKINNKVYIGKHESSIYDPRYLGSGVILLKALNRYGTDAFTNEVLLEAETIDELNDAEKRLISEYKTQYGDNCYNIAEGGTGGNVHRYGTEEQYKAFVDKMTEINSKRCKTEKFRKQISVATSSRYEDPEERRKTGEAVKRVLQTPEWGAKQSARLKQQWAEGLRTGDTLGYDCRLELNGVVKEFSTLAKCLEFLKTEYNFTPSKGLDYIIECTEKGETYIPFHKNKFKHLIGLKIYINRNRKRCRD